MDALTFATPRLSRAFLASQASPKPVQEFEYAKVGAFLFFWGGEGGEVGTYAVHVRVRVHVHM